MSETQAIVVAGHGALPATMENAPATVLAEAQKAAASLKDVISRKPKPVVINGEQYLEFEDWQTVGRFYGITVGIEQEPEFVQLGDAKGFKATSVALRAGQVISRATAYCLDDEEKWGAGDRKPPLFQLASMAQTRANAKALRNVLSWVAVLAGYRPTPAEEMDGVAGGRPTIPPCPKCKNAKKVIASKYAEKDGTRPWYCLTCKVKWGDANRPPQPPSDAPWNPDDEDAEREG